MPSTVVTHVFLAGPWRYVGAVAIFVGALLLRLVVLPVEAGPTYLTFYPATVLAFYVCGRRPGWLMVGLSALAGCFIFSKPYWSLSPSHEALVAVAVFVASAIPVNWIVEQLRGTASRLRGALRELKRSEDNHLTMLDNDLIGIVKLRDRRAIWVNKAMSRIFGYTQEEFLGESSRLLYPDDATFESYGAAAYADLRAGRQHRSAVRMRRKDGADLWIDSSGAMLSTEPGVSMWLLADITAIKDAAASMELARDRAEEATRAKSAFLANMSHEIRTPMNAIIGLTHLMKRDTHDTLERERLAKISDAAQHLLSVINDILDLSKIEAGRMTLEDTEFSLDTMLAGAFEMVKERANEKGLELILDTDHLPARLRGDPTRLSQSLINLLSNAVKFTHRGWVRLRGELLREEAGHIEVRFEVRDTGEGVAAERQGELFKAFEQGDKSITRRHGGTGLGLALTRHFATLMGGQVGVNSVPGQGSTFWFTARLARAAEADDRAAPIPIQGLRALLVDDLPEALHALTDRLEQLGLTVDAHDDAEAALARARAEFAAGRPYDVMLIDWRMTPVDGIETLQRLREAFGAGTPPSILVTAFDETLMWEQSHAARFDAVLVKPITGSTLHDTIARLMRRLPAAPAEALPEGQAEAELRRRHAGQRVLLVEDNPVNQEVALELLRSARLVVETADDGARAIELALTRPYDLILMDMQMPRVDGLAATRAIRERVGRGTPIVAMTANAFGEDRISCLEAGMNDHLAKPVNPEHLYATLLRWLPLREPRAPASRSGRAADAGSGRPPLPQRLEGLAGLDVAMALRNVGGQWPVLTRVLMRFAHTYRAGEPALLQTEDADALARWRVACHSLRGACSAIGAVALRQRLEEFEARLVAAAQAPVPELALPARAIHEELVAFIGELTTRLDD